MKYIQTKDHLDFQKTMKKQIADYLWKTFGKGFYHNPSKSNRVYENFEEAAEKIVDEWIP